MKDLDKKILSHLNKNLNRKLYPYENAFSYLREKKPWITPPFPQFRYISLLESNMFFYGEDAIVIKDFALQCGAPQKFFCNKCSGSGGTFSRKGWTDISCLKCKGSGILDFDPLTSSSSQV